MKIKFKDFKDIKSNYNRRKTKVKKLTIYSPEIIDNKSSTKKISSKKSLSLFDIHINNNTEQKRPTLIPKSILSNKSLSENKTSDKNLNNKRKKFNDIRFEKCLKIFAQKYNELNSPLDILKNNKKTKTTKFPKINKFTYKQS
jgi:hypothetical protein